VGTACELPWDTVGDPWEPSINPIDRNIVEPEIKAGESADLGDPGAHLSSANHPDLVDARFIYP